MANPIKTSDIYQDTGELTKLIAELEEAQRKFEALRKSAVSDAVKLEASIKSASAATSDQRDQIERGAKAADEIQKRYDKFTQSLEENAVKIAALKNAQQDMNRVNKLTAKLNAAAEGSYNQLSAQYSLIKLRLNQMSKAEREATDEGRKLVKQSAELYEEMKRLQAETGKHTLNVGNYRDALKDLPGPLAKFSGGLDTVRSSMKALLRNPIVLFLSAIVGALAALGGAFLRSEKGAELMARTTGILSGLMSKLTDIAVGLADGLIRAFTDPIGAIKDFGAAIGNSFKAFFSDPLGTIKEFGRAVKGEIQAIKEEAEAFGNLEVIKRNTIKTNRELSKSIEQLTTQEELYQVIADDTTKSFAEREEAAEKARRALEARSAKEIELARNNLAVINQELALRRENRENVEALLDQQLSAYQQLAQAERTYTLAVANNERTRAELKQDRLERDLDILIDGFDNQKTINERLIADENRTLSERARIYGETAELAEATFAKQIETIQQFTGIAVDANELLATSDAVTLNERIRSLGLSEIIEGRLLEVIRERRTALQDLLEVELELRDERLKAARTDTIDFIGGGIDRTAVQTLERQADEVAKIARRNTGVFDQAGSNQPQNIYDLLGLNLDDSEQQAIADATSFAIGQIQQLAQAKVQAAEQAVQASDREVQAAQANLQATIALAEQGYAVNVQAAQQELALAEQRQQEALKQQREAQRQQRLIESIQQASSLVTAAAKIFATVPFPGSLAAVSTMFGAFAFAKLRAAKLTREFGEGDYSVLNGPRHTGPGTGIPLGIAADGVTEYAEGGEGRAIFSRLAVRKYGSQIADVVRQFNSLTFGEGAMSMGRNAMNAIVVNSGVNTGRMETYLHELNQHAQTKTYTDSRGRLVVQRGNNTTVYN